MPFLSASVIYRHIFVMKSVLVTIRREVKLVPGRETGGPLVGYLTGDGAIVVTHAGGPGPNAVHARYSMEVDGAHAQRFCDGLRNATDGRLDYVGDWHNHPGFSLKPSTHDVAAIRTMANFEYCPIRRPISLIYRSFPEKFIVYALSDNESALVPVKSSTIKLPPA